MGMKRPAPEQPLFDIAIARASDPGTSHAAAERHRASGRLGSHRELVLAKVRETPGLTARELCARHGVLDRHEWSRRLADLERLGLVRKGPERDATVGGRTAREVTWLPVEDAK